MFMLANFEHFNNIFFILNTSVRKICLIPNNPPQRVKINYFNQSTLQAHCCW